MKVRSIGALGVLVLAASSCVAQTRSSGNTDTSSTKTAVPSEGTAAKTEKKPPKKVWTNEEIASVRGDISVVGEAQAPPADLKKPAGTGGADEARQYQLKRYRKQVQQYRAQMESLDKQIARFKNFKGENTSPSQGINPYQGYSMVPVEEQVKQLEEKKKQLEKKIEDTEVEAQKNGIEPGELR